MRKPLVSPKMAWMATVTIQSLVTALLFGPLLAPISLTTGLQLNGTTTSTTAATPVANSVLNDGGATAEPETTIASFLQSEISESTLSPQLASQVDELTTISTTTTTAAALQSNLSPSQESAVSSSSSPLTKRHSSIVVGESSSQNDDDAPKFITKASTYSTELGGGGEGAKEKPQKNGIGVNTTTISVATTESKEGDGEQQSLSLSSTETTAEQSKDNELPSTTSRQGRGNGDDGGEEEEGTSVSTNSLGNDDVADSVSSLDKDESDTYFSSGDEDTAAENNSNITTNEGDSEAVRGEIGGDTIFPPEEEHDELETNESVGATTFASLLRPAPTTNPQAFSFSSQLSNKLNRGGGGGGNRVGNGRLGTRGLSAKSELNAITASTTTIKAPTTNSNSSISASSNDNDSSTGSTTSGSGNRNKDNSAREAVIEPDQRLINNTKNNNSRNINSNISTVHNNSSDNTNSSSRFNLNGSSFQSRSNYGHAAQQQKQNPETPQQLLRARPTASVINNYNTNNNHNNNLHNRIIKRKKIPFGRGNTTTTAGASLSSIYGNSILTSTLPSGGGEGDNAELTTVAAPLSSPSLSDSSLLSPSTTAGVSATTESNSLVNASQDDYDEIEATARNTSSSSEAHQNVAEAAQPQSSSASVSGTENNGSAPLSSSRAILGFGTSNYGKVKRPKPIIIRDRDDSVHVNNLSENSAAGSGLVATDETATLAGAGEEESNKPVGSNALPTPPYKRRVKMTSRRVSTPVVRPTEDFVVAPTTPTFVLPTASATAGDMGEEKRDNDTNRLMAEAASGATDYRHVQHVIRPSNIHEGYTESPMFSSRRVFKEEFGITRDSYGDDEEEDGDLEATTEYYSLENPTPYPIPMGVRSATRHEILQSEEGEPATGKGSGKKEDDNRYRDYYSEISSRSVEPGMGGGSGGNLHIKSDSHPDIISIVSPVTVTVTHTVVKTTPHIVPTATAEIALSSQSIINSNNNGHEFDDGNEETGVEKRDNNSAQQSIHQNLQPTPALPSSAATSPTTEATFEASQGPAIVSHSVPPVENVQLSTDSHHGASQEGIQSSHSDSHQPHEDSHRGNDHGQEGERHLSKQGNDHDDAGKPQKTPVVADAIQPTPVITSKNIKSVYFTQVEHPHYTSSSYEFTTSTMYSYSFPDHHDDSMHSYYPDMMNHDDHMHHHDDAEPHPASDHHHHHVEGEEDQSTEQERGHSPEVNTNGTTSSTTTDESTHTTVYDGQFFTPSPTPSQFWDDLQNLTKSSSSKIPITIEQEGANPTSLDVDIYPPLGTRPDSKPEDTTATTTPMTPSTVASTTTGSPVTTTVTRRNNSGDGSQGFGSLEENEISEEEQKKQQQEQNVGSSSGPTTIVPTSTTTKKAGAAGGNKISDNDTAEKDKSDDDNENKTSPSPGTTPDNKGTKIQEKNSTSSSGVKTPFGVGESFGIGSVHVPVMVQMILDLSQPVFCSHLSNFKGMIVTVYGTQKKAKVNPEQIVVYTEHGCGPSSSGESVVTSGPTSTVTVQPGVTTTGQAFSTTTTPKGTFPLTYPPGSGSGRDGEEDKKSRTGKNLTTAASSSVGKNGTASENDSLVENKSSELLSSDKSAEVVEEELATALNKSFAASTLIRSRRSTKMGTAAAAAKNTNISEDIKNGINFTSSTGGGGASTTENLLSVYFYVNNKNGSYDQDLTSSFVRLWNDSSRLTNVSNGNIDNGGGVGGGGEVGGNEWSSNSSSGNEMFIKKVKRVGMITANHLASTQEPSDENSGIIVAITVASIVAICLFLLGVGLLIMRHRQSQTKFAKRCTPVTLDDYSLDNISVYNSFRRKQRLRGSKRSYTNAAFDDPNAPSRPVNAQSLNTVLSDVISLENEFRAIPNIAATLDDIPTGAETKNRYANVIPMPDTRVLLTFLDDVPNSDYMNANYVRGGLGEQKRYIITQGPLEDTIVDFWRMVWEQQIRVILMLTDFAEGGIVKCAEYYPRSETIDCSQLHGDFQITLERRDIADNCITSYLVLKDMERNLRRDVVHFWYHSWPEKGVPASPKMTIDFLNRSKKFTKEPTPILVHCSPGTGRSGAVVACDIAMKEYDAQNKIDIPRIVMKLRQDRAGAVQTKEQYVHIYDVLHTYVSRIGGAAHLESI